MRNLPHGRPLAILTALAVVAAVLTIRGLVSFGPGQSTSSPGSSALPTPAASPSGAPVSTPIDTSGWTLVRVHALGFSIQLPPDFELVSDDTEKPVPSIAAIESIAPPIAEGLRSQAARLATAPGVFGELGLWGIEPGSLTQVGLLAGRPYRVAEADLEGIVRTAVAQRATPLEGGSVDRVELPSGTGFLAGYRDAVDLGAHREIHLRTPAGRYLVLVMSFIGSSIDRAAESRFLTIAGTIAPLEGAASGDVPAPSGGPEGHADPDLEQVLPERVGGVDLQRRSLNGEELVGGDLGSGTVLDAVGSLVPAPGKVSVALGVPASGTSDLVLTAFRLDGVDGSAIEARLAQFPAELWSHASMGGRDVLASVAGSDGRRTYLRVSANVLEEVVTADATVAAEAIAGLR
jgi:hypothetical protein